MGSNALCTSEGNIGMITWRMGSCHAHYSKQMLNTIQAGRKETERL
jgi:hypothetical protein